MTIKKLMAAVSVLALSATSASALSITNNNATIIPAFELSLPGVTPGPFLVPANFSLDVDTAGAFYPNGNNIAVVVTLPAGVVFNTQVTAGQISGNGGAVSPIVQSGGAPGSSSVSLLVSIQAATVTGINFTPNLGLINCPPPGSVVTMTANIDGSGTPIENGTATSATIIAPCASALTGTVVPDQTPPGSGTFSDTTISLASSYFQINENGGPSTLGALPIGDLNYTINPAVAITGTGTPMASTDVSGITFAVTFTNAAQVASVDLSTGSTATIAGNVATFNVTAPAEIAALTDGVADQITLTVLGTAAIQTQPVVVSSATVTFNDTTADLVPTEPGATGPIDTLQREGQNFGPFDWNGSSASQTVSVYRVTGLTGPTVYSVLMTNSGANGTYTATATPNANGEAIINSVGFGAGVPAYGRGDAQFIFETNTSLDVDRLMARNGIVSAFNDGANGHVICSFTPGGLPSGDSDNGCTRPVSE